MACVLAVRARAGVYEKARRAERRTVGGSRIPEPGTTTVTAVFRQEEAISPSCSWRIRIEAAPDSSEQDLTTLRDGITSAIYYQGTMYKFDKNGRIK